MSQASEFDAGSFAEIVGDPRAVAWIRAASPSAGRAVSDLWTASVPGDALSPRLTELILLAMHASATALNVDAIGRHAVRARTAGATDAEIIDVLVTIAGVANHALYVSAPILLEEWEAAGGRREFDDVPDSYASAKADFVSERGFWNPERDVIARLMPDYFVAQTTLAIESWKNGALSPLERELVCIAIDCTVTHVYEAGLRLHLKNAIGHGATPRQLAGVLQLAATLGLEAIGIAARALSDEGEE